MPIVPTGYVVAVCNLVVGSRDGERGGQALADVATALETPRGEIHHATDPTTLVVLWPAESVANVDAARQFVVQLQDEAMRRSGTARARVRAGIGGYHPGLRGISRSYLEAQQAIEAGRKLRPEAVVHRHDELIPRLALLSLAQAAPRPKTIRRYDAGHGLNSAAVHDQLRWLAKELGLDGPVVRGALAGP